MRAEQRVDLLDPAGYVGGQPHDVFGWLRRNDPVHRHAEPGGRFDGDAPGPGFWAVTRYDDVKAVGRDPVTFSSRGGIFIEGPALPPPPEDPAVVAAGMSPMMLFLDPPVHSVYRHMTNRQFTPRAANRLTGRIGELATTILDAVVELGSCDLVADIAGELPSFVVADLLGIPLEDGRKLYEYTERVHALPDERPGASADRGAAAGELARYGMELAQRKRADPGDDLSSALLAADVEGRPLSDFEFMQYFILLVDAGGDTTRNLVAGGMQALFDHPEQLAWLREDLDERLPGAVEELLRWCSPVVYMRRVATREATLGGHDIRPGDKVVMFYGSANRDESVFPDAGDLRLDRAPNEHVAFGGGGPHFCLGAHLARIEIQVMLREILTRIPDLQPDGPVEWLRSTFISGPKRMPVRFTPSARSA